MTTTTKTLTTDRARAHRLLAAIVDGFTDAPEEVIAAVTPALEKLASDWGLSEIVERCETCWRYLDDDDASAATNDCSACGGDNHVVAEAMLDAAAVVPRCGLNADLNCQAWFFGPTRTPFVEAHGIYILDCEEDDAHGVAMFTVVRDMGEGDDGNTDYEEIWTGTNVAELIKVANARAKRDLPAE